MRVFKNIFEEPIKVKSKLCGLEVKGISQEDNTFMVSEFSREEVRAAV